MAKRLRCGAQQQRAVPLWDSTSLPTGAKVLQAGASPQDLTTSCPQVVAGSIAERLRCGPQQQRAVPIGDVTSLPMGAKVLQAGDRSIVLAFYARAFFRMIKIFICSA